jgi:hypothetical protein
VLREVAVNFDWTDGDIERLWFLTDVFGLFSKNAVSFSLNLVLSGPLFSANMVQK